MRASLPDQTHRGEALTAAQGAAHSILEKPCQTIKSVTVGNLHCFRGRVNESRLRELDHKLTRSHAHSCAQEQHKQLLEKLSATNHLLRLILHFSEASSESLTVLKETYSLIRRLSKLPSPRECPAEKGFFFAEINNCFPIRSCSGKIMPPLHSSKAIFFPSCQYLSYVIPANH